MVNYVTVISTEINNLSQRIVKFLRNGKDDIQTTEQITPFGVDSNPLKDMVAIYSPTKTKGGNVIIGYINRNQLADIGENRIFSEDSSGDLSTFIWLKNDGTMQIGGDSDNMVRYSTLKSEYDKTKDVLDSILTILTGAPINEPGNGSPSALQAALSGALAGKATGDITGSKIEEIKTL